MAETFTITEDSWPRFLDGRRKKIGEMTRQEVDAVTRAAIARLNPEFAWQGVDLRFADNHTRERG